MQTSKVTRKLVSDHDSRSMPLKMNCYKTPLRIGEARDDQVEVCRKLSEMEKDLESINNTRTVPVFFNLKR